MLYKAHDGIASRYPEGRAVSRETGQNWHMKLLPSPSVISPCRWEIIEGAQKSLVYLTTWLSCWNDKYCMHRININILSERFTSMTAFRILWERRLSFVSFGCTLSVFGSSASSFWCLDIFEDNDSRVSGSSELGRRNSRLIQQSKLITKKIRPRDGWDWWEWG